MEDMQPYLDGIFRWVHIVAGITWIGLLYFFNWVNSAFAPTLDAESKKKVLPELLPRTLFWFRWGAAYTWFSGLLLLGILFYHGNKIEVAGETVSSSILWADGLSKWGAMPLVMIAITFGGVFIYDILCKTAFKTNQAAFGGGVIIVSALWIFYREVVTDVSLRGAAIHIGAMFGTFMAFNVWFRIWPAQQKIITAIKNGEAPDGDLVKLAGTRSKHNTYMSFPLVFTMINQTWSTWDNSTFAFPIVLAATWGLCYVCYKKAAQVPGF